MDKRRWSIGNFQHFWGLSSKEIWRIGKNVCHMWNLLTIGVCMVQQIAHHLKLYMDLIYWLQWISYLCQWRKLIWRGSKELSSSKLCMRKCMQTLRRRHSNMKSNTIKGGSKPYLNLEIGCDCIWGRKDFLTKGNQSLCQEEMDHSEYFNASTTMPTS